LNGSARYRFASGMATSIGRLMHRYMYGVTVGQRSVRSVVWVRDEQIRARHCNASHEAESRDQCGVHRYPVRGVFPDRAAPETAADIKWREPDEQIRARYRNALGVD